MDSANKQSAIVSEVTQGTTPASPGFKLLRDINISGSPVRNSSRSPERRADRMAANMVTGLNSYAKTINMPWVRDAGTDILWASAFGGTFSTNVLKNGSTPSFFTLEEKYEGGSTDPYRRLAGCQVNSVGISFRLGDAGQLTFGLMAMSESNATSAIASSTYANPTPAYDPVSSVDITVTSMFGLSSPKVTGLSMQITNNLANLYKFGSADPFGLGYGLFDVSGQLELYFQQAADYTGFVTRATGQTFDITIGSQSGSKDQLVMGAVDVFNPDISDPGQSGQHMVTLNFMAKYYANDSAAIKLTRNV
jgi:hypothetical protein